MRRAEARTQPHQVIGLAARINDALPQTQCTRCGYPDCASYAQAVADGEADIGILAGDVVVAMNTTKLYRVEDLGQALARVPAGNTVALLVMRDRRLAYVAVRLPAARHGRS